MATVMKRPSGKWQATVRKDGRSCSKSFTKRVEANKWARNTELKAESVGLQQTSAPAIEEMTLGQVLERYRDEITSKKRCVDNERHAINGFLRSNLATLRFSKLVSAEFVVHRDRRLQKMKPSTVVRELGWIQHAIDIACTDWGQRLPDGNPVKQVRRPKIDNCQRRRKNLPLGRSKRRPHGAASWGVMPSSSKPVPRRVGRQANVMD